MNKRSSSIVGIGLALVLFLAVNVLAGATLRSWRVDLTEGDLYTLTEGSKRVARSVDEKIRLYLYVSEGLSKEVPAFETYARRVRELLEEYEIASDGKIEVEVVDPEPFSEEEDRAVAEGLQGLPLGSGERLFLGLVGTSPTGESEVIPFLSPQRERFLEYDVSRLIHTLDNPEKQVVGILTTLPMRGGRPQNPMAPPEPGWQIVEQLRELFEVRFLEASMEEVPEDVDVLMLVHPKDLPDAALYAIDQYVLAGGEALVFVDPFCEADRPAQDPSNPMASMQAPRASNPKRLLAAWGLELVPEKFVGDRENALRISGPRGRAVDFVGYVGLDEEEMDDEDPVTSLLSSVVLGMPGCLRRLEDATTTVSPLLRSSEDAMLIDVGSVQFGLDPDSLLANFAPDYEELTLAARVTGEVESAFPEGPPSGLPENGPGEDGTDGQGEEGEGDGAEPAHLSVSEGPVNLVVVADCDMLVDRLWIREESLFGQISLGWRKTADNGDLAINACENLAGGEDLISIRAQGRYTRPFERVEEIRREAEQRHLQEKQELERKLQTVQSRINELQREKTPDSALILSPEQEEELARAEEEMLATRKRLREVEHDLRKDIEALGKRLKWVNILLVPGLVAVAAIALGVWRVQRRAKK